MSSFPPDLQYTSGTGQMQTQVGTVRSAEPPEDVPPDGAPPLVDDGQQGQDDYFAFAERRDETFIFPDKKTYVSFRKLDEGAKRRYEARTQGAFELDRRSGNARVKVDPGLQRQELILAAATGWNLRSKGNPIPFSPQNVERWIAVADPDIIQNLSNAIEKLNTWMRSEVTSADIRTEIANLEEDLKEVLAREAGEASSSVR